jgi:hypothetical protein
MDVLLDPPPGQEGFTYSTLSDNGRLRRTKSRGRSRGECGGFDESLLSSFPVVAPPFLFSAWLPFCLSCLSHRETVYPENKIPSRRSKTSR